MDKTRPPSKMPGIAPRAAARAATRYVVSETGCWLSTYSTASHGYAQVGWCENGKTWVTVAHRAAWTYHHGPIPEGMTIDHLCKVRPCVNPTHLRLLSNVANATDNGMDKLLKSVLTDRKCKVDPEHKVYRRSSGYHQCYDCKNAKRRARREADKAAGRPKR